MFTWVKRHKWLVSLILLLAIWFLRQVKPFENPLVVGDGVDRSVVSGEKGVARFVEPGWSVPVKLEFNDIGWEDSSYITRDGKNVLIFYNPVKDQFNKAAKEALGDENDGRIYYSPRPFTSKILHPVSGKSRFAAEGGPYIAENGDFYYMKISIFGKQLKVFKNRKKLDLKTGGGESNPHYCDMKGELYFDAPDGQKIAVSKDGHTNFLPSSINKPGTQNFQPFLTDDCQTLYFTSTRGAWQGILPFQVYKSERVGNLEWTEPSLFLSFPELGGVGEFSMTRDGRQAVFTQMRRDSDGVFRNNIYYAERY